MASSILVGRLAKLDPGVARLCVTDDVRQRLLGDAETGGPDVGGKKGRVRRDEETHLEGIAPHLAVDVPAERVRKAGLVEKGRPEVEREVADRPDRPVGDLAGLLEDAVRRGVGGFLRRLHSVEDGGEKLADLVVKLPREVPSLALLDV